ncbi:class I SAM-dependent methyltransferase [bacterium]|nr:class I SAM-dependent methyltransferase [bacterium]
MEGEYQWVYEMHDQEEHLTYLKNYLPLINKGIKDIVEKEKVILDLGAGCCETSYLFTHYGAWVIAMDMMPEFIRCGQAFIDQDHYFERLVGDIEILPFADHSFDLVFCKEILHHLPSLSNVVSEIARILKPKGKCVVWEPVKGILEKKEDEEIRKSGLSHHGYSFFNYQRYFSQYFKLTKWEPLLEKVKVKKLITLPSFLLPLYLFLRGGGIKFKFLLKEEERVPRLKNKVVPFTLERFHRNDLLVEREKETKMKKELEILQSIF